MIDNYKIQEQAGKGGFSTIYRALQVNTGQSVALKILNSDGLNPQSYQRYVRRFERETHLCADLNHPNIVKLLDKGITKDQQYYAVFEFVPGVTLKEKLAQDGPMTATETGELMGQVLDALACVHARGVVHRDLKPQNIMVSSTGVKKFIKLLDFGIGTFLPEARQPNFQDLTLTQDAVGTPSYSAPEQLRGEPPTVKSDIYAWGLLFLECLTGKPVMQGATLAETFHKQLSSHSVPLPEALLGHPIANLLQRALNKDPRRRAESAVTLYEDFRKLNLSNIVGDVHYYRSGPQCDVNAEPDDETIDDAGARFAIQSERRQITALCCKVDVSSLKSRSGDLEIVEALQRELLNVCIDLGISYGGFNAGTLGDCALLYFGYPYVTDSDARRAARTALELVLQFKNRSNLLETAQGFNAKISIGIHSDNVIFRDNNVPSGVAASFAMKLVHIAQPGEILVSESTQKILRRFIDFDYYPSIHFSGGENSLAVYLMKGERQIDAFSLLSGNNGVDAFVGRQDEVNFLTGQLQNLDKNGSRVILLEGEAGIGKSRLIQQLRQHSASQDVDCQTCMCLAEYRNSALQPIINLLKKRLQLQETIHDASVLNHISEKLQESGVDHEQILPVLCAWMSLPIPENVSMIQYSPEKQKRILINFLINFLFTSHDQQNQLFVVEDVHWMDPTTEEFVLELMVQAKSVNILVVLTARPGAKNTLLDNVDDKFTLQKLPPVVSSQLISELTGYRKISQKSLDRLIRRTDGIPLFIEELIKTLQEAKAFVEVNGELELKQVDDDSAIPVTLRDSLNERLSRLGTAKETAQIAAAIGREFAFSLIEALAVTDILSLQSDLEKMVNANLVIRQRRVEGDNYIFKHALIRDAAYESMLQPTRQAVHAKIAGVLKAEFQNRIESNPLELALHLAEAGEFRAALQYSTKAARDSLSRSSIDETISIVSKSNRWLALITEDENPEFEIELNAILTQALMARRGWADEQVKALIDRSDQLIKKVGDTNLQIPNLWSLIIFHHVAGNRATVSRLIDQFESILKPMKNSGLDVVAAAIKGLSQHADGNYPEAADSLNFAIDNYQFETHKHYAVEFGLDSFAWAASALGLVEWFQDKQQSAYKHVENAVEWGKKINHIPSTAIAILYRTMVYQYAGDKKAVEESAGELLKLCEKYDLPAYAGYAAILQGWAHGDICKIENIVSVLKKMGCNLALTYYASLPSEIASWHGDYEYAVEVVNNSIALCKQNAEWMYYPELLLRKALYSQKLTKPENNEIEYLLLKAVNTADTYGMAKTSADANKLLSQLSESSTSLII